jgi:enoyl-[acyl-carrier protein] reductase III
MNINARAALFASQKAVPLMQKRGGGAIVNVSSMGSLRTLPDYAVIGASKAALEAITRYSAVEFAKYNVVVNAVSPGIIDTDALDYFRLGRDVMVEGATARTPAGRIVEAQDVANLIAFLCSPEARMIRGQVVVIDGGYTIAVT